MTTALIIDDNAMNLETLRVLLKKEGVNAVTLVSPTQLDASLANLAETIAVVFLDLEFPNHNGFQVIHTLKAHSKLINVPIIAYTVYISEQNEARAAGFSGFIGKPLNPQKFPDQLRRILNGESVWDVGQ